ncbi:hypothetical protein [Streptomyces boluensis]|nr:hypothetical protein [Streptomyces boluensis]
MENGDPGVKIVLVVLIGAIGTYVAFVNPPLGVALAVGAAAAACVAQLLR